jgi:hypothetical protein
MSNLMDGIALVIALEKINTPCARSVAGVITGLLSNHRVGAGRIVDSPDECTVRFEVRTPEGSQYSARFDLE